MMLIKKNATVTICHTRTVDMPSVVKEADIVIVAAGRAGVVDDTYVSLELVWRSPEWHHLPPTGNSFHRRRAILRGQLACAFNVDEILCLRKLRDEGAPESLSC